MQKEQDEIYEITDSIKELSEDPVLPKNIKTRFDEMADILKDNTDVSLRIHKVLQVLEEVVEDKNLQTFTRTQIYNLISMLESASF